MSYAHPETLVSTAWVEEHLHDRGIRIVEVDVDRYSYEEGHIPCSLGWDWMTELCDTTRRDILTQASFDALMSNAGIAADTAVVLHGDNNNWFAAWAFWQMKIYGHADVRMMNGGRRKWLAEGRPLTQTPPEVAPTRYTSAAPDRSLRALLPEVLEASRKRDRSVVDVRSEAEFKGELLSPPGLPETCQRGGHIPGAANVPWGEVCGEDGEFKTKSELEAIYRRVGVTPDRPTIAYCRIGERSSHTWFVLKYLLGFPDVRNYDGSWTEWGNLVNVDIERS